MRFASCKLNAGLTLSVVSVAALGALGCAASFAQSVAPTLPATAFTSDFSEMAKLKALAEKGKGKIGVLLPETTTSARYTSFDAPYLKEAFEAAGLLGRRRHHHQRAGQRVDRTDPGPIGHHPGREGAGHGSDLVGRRRLDRDPTPSPTACRSSTTTA